MITKAKQFDELNITVVGLGLMGGSLCKALRKNSPSIKLIGADLDEAVLKTALQENIIDETLNDTSIAKTDILIFAIPPLATVKVLKEMAPKLEKGTIVTDLCGVKRYIVENCTPICEEFGLHFIGAHPMAGKEKSGILEADDKLFIGASFIITPTDNTPQFVIDTISELSKVIGCAQLTVTNPEEHDRMIAFTSQLPHVLAGCYVQSPCSARHKGFSAGSYRDVSRVATVDENLWCELFAENSDLLSAEVEQLITRLEAFRKAIVSKDKPSISRMLKEGRISKLRADGIKETDNL